MSRACLSAAALAAASATARAAARPSPRGARSRHAAKSFPTTMVTSASPDGTWDTRIDPDPQRAEHAARVAPVLVAERDDLGPSVVEGLGVGREHDAEPLRDQQRRHVLTDARRAAAVLHQGRDGRRGSRTGRRASRSRSGWSGTMTVPASTIEGASLDLCDVGAGRVGPDRGGALRVVGLEAHAVEGGRRREHRLQHRAPPLRWSRRTARRGRQPPALPVISVAPGPTACPRSIVASGTSTVIVPTPSTSAASPSRSIDA